MSAIACMNLTLNNLEINKDLLTFKGFLIIWLSILLIMIVPDEGDSRNVPDEGDSRNASCILHWISMFFFNLNYEMLDDIKRVITSRKSKDRQYNGQMKQDKKNKQ